MGAIAVGAQKALAELTQKDAEERQKASFEAGRNKELLNLALQDEEAVKGLGYRLEANDGPIGFFEIDGNSQQPGIVVGYDAKSKQYIFTAFGVTKEFKTADEALQEIGVALQTKKWGGEYGVIRLWD
ncbi:hypothetical protein [Mesorhizobium sp. B1-1-5]|uniref:hypothetical protein n=1 Tax=Mesorhizobium sp. B1-1-5 TaxID=2589979 RepID=UPI00112CFB1F|nr:hypothetical protein [Mesorhizobium sp. B1-1-5]TPO10097.1 hypothetical protein FJ980_09385 [Mesorhizobium sp. B1-1-5]